MKAYHTHELAPARRGREIVVRRGFAGRAVNALISFVIVIGATSGAAYLIHLRSIDQLPDGMDGIWFYVLVFALAVFAMPPLYFLRYSVRPGGWLVRLRDDALVVKFRSDQNAQLPEPHPVLLEVPYRELRWARGTREWVRSYGLSSDGPTLARVRHLDLKVARDADGLDEARRAVDAEIAYRPEGSYTLSHDYPLRIDGEVLRLAWWWGLRPSLGRVLKRLRRHVTVERPLDLTVDLRDPPDVGDADERALELARRGAHMAAIGLARRTHGLSLAEAKGWVQALLVEALLEEGADPAP